MAPRARPAARPGGGSRGRARPSPHSYQCVAICFSCTCLSILACHKRSFRMGRCYVDDSLRCMCHCLTQCKEFFCQHSWHLELQPASGALRLLVHLAIFLQPCRMLCSVPMQCLPRRRSKKSGGPSYTATTQSPLRCWNPTERAPWIR